MTSTISTKSAWQQHMQLCSLLKEQTFLMHMIVATTISASAQAAFVGCCATCDTVLDGKKDVYLADCNFVLHYITRPLLLLRLP